MAYVIPVKMEGRTPAGRGPQLLIVVLTKDNFDRMKEHDPFDIQCRAYSPMMDLSGRITDLDLIIAYEEDGAELERLAQAGDIREIMKYVERGRVHRAGDAVAPYSVKGKVK